MGASMIFVLGESGFGSIVASRNRRREQHHFEVVDVLPRSARNGFRLACYAAVK